MSRIKTAIDRIANALGYIKSVAVSTHSMFDIPASPPRKATDFLGAYESWVYPCVKARAEDTSGITLHLYRRKKGGEVEEVNDHEVQSLLRSVNPHQTFRQLIEATQAYKDLAGEAFWFLDRVNPENPKSQIKGIWILRPDWIKIIADKEKFVSHYVYTVGGEEIELQPHEIVHFKEFNPLDPYRGLSIIKAAAVTIDSENFAQEYNRKFFENSAIPSLVLSTEQKLDDDTSKRMKQAWANEFGGRTKAHRMAILEGGLKIEPFSMSHKDMEFLQGLDYTRDKIFAMFQVPKSRLGMTNEVTVSNAEATDIIFKRTVKALMLKIVDTLNESLLPHYRDGAELFFDFDDPVPENMDQKIRVAETLFKTGGASPNDIREMFGEDRIEGLDRYYLPINFVPIMKEGEGDDADDEPVKGHARKRLPAPPPKHLKEKIAEGVANDVRNEVVKALASKVKMDRRKEQEQEAESLGSCQLSVEAQEAHHKSILSISDRFEKQYHEKILDTLHRQRDEAAQRLEDATKGMHKALTAAQAKKVLFDVTAETKVTAEITVPLLRELAQEIGDEELTLLGLDDLAFDNSTAAMSQFYKTGALKGIRGMNKHTKNILRQLLADAIAEGVGIPETKARILAKFNEMTPKRAEKIARTETFKASNKATVEAYKQSGSVVGKQWFTAFDERVCAMCGPLHEKVISVDGDFFEKGETQIGSDGRKYPVSFENVPAPPRHPNCRCTLVPVTIVVGQ